MNKFIRVALAGAGAFGIKHLDGIKNIDGVEVVSVIGRELDDQPVRDRLLLVNAAHGPVAVQDFVDHMSKIVLSVDRRKLARLREVKFIFKKS